MTDLRKLVALAAALYLVAFIGCGGSGGSGDSTPATADPVDNWHVLEDFDPPEANVLIGQVLSPGGTPISGATVSVEGGPSATTDPRGYYYLEGVDLGKVFYVHFSASGFSPLIKKAKVNDGTTSTMNGLLLPHVQSRKVTAADGGEAAFDRGAVAFKPGTIVDSSGAVVDGAVNVRMSIIDIRSNQLLAAPGDFTARDAANEDVTLETFGLSDISVEMNGETLNIKEGETAELEILLPDDTELQEGDEVPLWYFDEPTGKWVEEGMGVVTSSARYPGRLGVVGDVGHFSWWNCDKPMEVACLKGQVKKCDGSPAAGAYVQAHGIDYDGITEAHADENGQFCIPVRIASKVKLMATYGWGEEALVSVKEVDTPAEASNCDNPSGCDVHDMELPCDPSKNEVDCTDTYFVPCKGSVKGKVVDENGEPVALAEVTVKSGNTTYIVYTNSNGEYCSKAGLDTLTTLFALSPIGASVPVAVKVTEESLCPDGTVAPDLVVQGDVTASGDDDDIIDLCKCQGLSGTVSMNPISVESAAPEFATMTAGFGVAYLQENSEGVKKLSLDLTFYPPCSSGNNALPTATADLDVPVALIKAATPMNEDWESEIYFDGTASLRPKLPIHMGNQTFKLNSGGEYESTEGPVSSITLDSADIKAGGTLKGSYELYYEPRCAPAGGLVLISGSFDLPIRDSSSVLWTLDMESESFTAWMCSMASLLIELELGWLGSYGAGSVQLEVDGLPIPFEDDWDSSARFRPDDNVLQLDLNSSLLHFYTSVDGPVEGANPVENGNLMMETEEDCYNSKPTGTVIIQGTPGAPDSFILTGSFDIDYSPSEGSSGAGCKDHKATGLFIAPTCFTGF